MLSMIMGTRNAIVLYTVLTSFPVSCTAALVTAVTIRAGQQICTHQSKLHMHPYGRDTAYQNAVHIYALYTFTC